MSRTEDCVCKTDGIWHNRMEYFKINDSRMELRCGNCNGLVNWWVEHPRPFERGWTKKGCEAMCWIWK